jgi:hypothetical protein
MEIVAYLSTFLGFFVFSREFPSFYAYFFGSPMSFLETSCPKLGNAGQLIGRGFGHFEAL